MSKPIWSDMSDEVLLKAVKDELIRLNTKSSNVYQKKRDRSLPSHTYLMQRFGSWNTMLEKAGLQIGKKRYTDEELLGFLKKYADEHGHPPRAHEPSLPSISVYVNHFGSWEQALKKAGLHLFRPHKSLDELEIFVRNWLTRFVEKNHRVPSRKDWDDDPDTMKLDNIEQRLNKHWTDLWRDAGFEPPHPAKYDVERVTESDDKLLELYRELCKKLNRTATISDMRKEEGFYDPGVFIYRFGSLYRLRELAGVEQVVGREIKYTDEEIKNELVNAYLKTGRVTVKEFNSNLPFQLHTAYRRLGIYNIDDMYDFIEQELIK